MIVYYNGQYVDKSKVRISPDDRGFLFADGVYDVIRSYRGLLFRCAEHLQRIAFGLKELRIQGCDTDSFEAIALHLLKANELTDQEATVYFQVTRGAASPRTHRFPPANIAPTVYVEAKLFSPTSELRQTGAGAIIVPDQRWGRCDIKNMGLAANVLASQQAHEAGAFEAIFSRDGFLLEGSHSSILFVKEETLICPPLSRLLLPSVTRVAVLEAAQSQAIQVATRPCPETELLQFDEVLMLGTSAEIVPIIAVNGSRIGAGTPGPITRRLQTAFEQMVTRARLELEPAPLH